MKLTEQELTAIRSVSIHKILGMKQNGTKIMVRCPFHSERTPSFVLFPDGGYKCFGCGKSGGNAIDFVVDLGFTFPNAVNELIKYL